MDHEDRLTVVCDITIDGKDSQHSGTNQVKIHSCRPTTRSMLKRKRVHIENEKNDLFKKKNVNEGLVDFISNTIEEKTKDVSCPVCFETAETPIYMCSMAHLICKNCLPKLKICPECRWSDVDDKYNRRPINLNKT